MRRKAASRAERSEERERSSASSWSKTKESRAEREGGFEEEEGVAGEGREVWEEEKQKGRRRRRRDSLEVAQWRRRSDCE